MVRRNNKKGKKWYKREWKRSLDPKMKYHGEIDYEKKTIKVNPKKMTKGGPIDSIVHEEMHKSHPKMTEKQVVKKTKRKMKKITTRTARKLVGKYRRG